MDILNAAIRGEKKVVTTKWLSSQAKIEFDQAQRIMNEYFRNAMDGTLLASFLVTRKTEYGFTIAIIRREELLADEIDNADIYSIQESGKIDLNLIGSINKGLSVEPVFKLVDLVTSESVNNLSNFKIIPSSETSHIQSTTALIPITTAIPTTTVIPTKNPIPIEGDQALKNSPKKIKNLPTKGKNRHIGFPTKSENRHIGFPTKSENKSTNIPIKNKNKPVDLQSKLASELFTTDENEINDQPKEDLDVQVNPKQSFVDFSSDEESHSINEPTPIEPQRSEVEATITTSNISRTPSQSQMKMVKVPKTFMENGYLVTEYVTEMVKVGNNDENESNQERISTPEQIPSNHDKPEKIPTATKPLAAKQGSLLNFFKPRKQ